MALLEPVAVHPDIQRRELGGRLVKHMKKDARRLGSQNCLGPVAEIF